MLDTLLYHGWILHLICGFFITLIMGLWWRPFVVLGFLAGFFKEVFDYYTPTSPFQDHGLFDPVDMYMTWVGTIAGIFAVCLLYKKFRRYVRYLDRTYG